MYEDYMPVTKRKSKGTVRKASSDRINRREFRQSRKPIHPISPNFISSTSIREIRLIKHTHDHQGTIHEWSKNDINRMNRAIKNAITHLDKAEKFLEEENSCNMYDIIIDAVRRVRSVLAGEDGELSIFPLPLSYQKERKNKEDEYVVCYGMSLKDKHEMSICIELHESDSKLSKTLIHEAFHIIGGCMPYKKTLTSKKLFDPDLLCSDDVEQNAALTSIQRYKDIIKIPADLFAQFVMRCE